MTTTAIFVLVTLILLLVPIFNIIVFLGFLIIKKSFNWDNFKAAYITFLVEVLLFSIAFIAPNGDGGVFSQILFAEIAGIVTAVLQILSIFEARRRT